MPLKRLFQLGSEGLVSGPGGQSVHKVCSRRAYEYSGKEFMMEIELIVESL